MITKYYIIPILLFYSGQTLAQITAQITNASGYTTNDGSIILSVQGGLPPYTYQWNYGSGNSNELLNLYPGDYCVTVTDITGCCYMYDCFTVGSDCPYLMYGLQYTNVCKENDGALTVFLANDGTPPYNYLWSTGATTQSVTGLSTGRYCVTVTDQAGCSAHTCMSLKKKVSVSGNVTNACLGQSNGAIDLPPSSGIAPHTYIWSNGATTQDITNLSIGTYCVTVTDFAGCTNSICFAVENKIKINATVFNNCLAQSGQGNGKIELSLTGEVSPVFQWSNGATTKNIENLSNGQYCVTVTNQNGCSNTACFNITNFYAITTSISACPGQNNGSIDLTPIGSLPPLSYVWSTGATNEDIKNLPGNKYYYYTVTDSRGCVTKNGTSVEETFYYLNAFVKNYCAPGDPGTINLYEGSNASYQWSNGANTAYLQNLNPGQYCCTITAPNGCTVTKCYEVGTGLSANGIYIKSINQVSSCFKSGAVNWNACDGSVEIGIDANAIKGWGPFTFAWSGPNGFSAMGSTISGLCVGTYTVTVTSSSGCSAIKTVDVCCCEDESEEGHASAETCYDGDNTTSTTINIIKQNTQVVAPSPDNNFQGGKIILFVSGPTGPTRIYNWTGPNGFKANTKNISNLASGEYCVTVTDGCQSTNTCFNLGFCDPYRNNALGLELSPFATCEGGHSGRIRATSTYGTGPYTFSWGSGAIYNTSFSHTFGNLSEGVYTVTVTDSKYCTATATTTIQTDEVNGYIFPLKNLEGFDAVDPCFNTLENARIKVIEDDCYGTNGYDPNIPSGGYPYYVQIEWPNSTYSTLKINGNNDCEAIGPDDYNINASGTYVCAMIDQYGCRKEWCFEFGEETNVPYPALNTVTPPGDESNPFSAITGCYTCKNCGQQNCASPHDRLWGCDYNTQKFVYRPSTSANPCGGGGSLSVPCGNSTITIPPSNGIEYIDWESGQGVAEGICEYKAGCLFLGLTDAFFQGQPVYVETKIRIANPSCHSPVPTPTNPYVECPGGVTYSVSDDEDCWGTVICRSTGAIIYEGVLEEFTKICYVPQTENLCDKVKICTLTTPYTIIDIIDADVECPNDCSEFCTPCVARPAAKQRDEYSNLESAEPDMFKEGAVPESLRAYPNPFEQHLVIEFNSSNDKNSAQIAIFDMLGKVKLQSTMVIREGVNRFTISSGDNFASGIYFVVIKDENGHIATAKVIRMSKS